MRELIVEMDTVRTEADDDRRTGLEFGTVVVGSSISSSALLPTLLRYFLLRQRMKSRARTKTAVNEPITLPAIVAGEVVLRDELLMGELDNNAMRKHDSRYCP